MTNLPKPKRGITVLSPEIQVFGKQRWVSSPSWVNFFGCTVELDSQTIVAYFVADLLEVDIEEALKAVTPKFYSKLKTFTHINAAGFIDIPSVYKLIDWSHRESCSFLDERTKRAQLVREWFEDMVLPVFYEYTKSKLIINITNDNTNVTKEIEMLSINDKQPLTMSSLDIAKLCDKEHRNVLADIKSMLKQLDISTAEFSAVYKADNNQTYECFNLNKELTLTLVAGYKVKLRNTIIKRWQELESQVTQQALPTNYKEALLALVAKEEQTEKLVLTLKQTETKLEEAKPLIGFAETVAKADSGILVNALAHLAQNEHDIKIGEKRLWKWLRMMGLIQQQKPLPTQKAQDLGLFVVQPRMIAHHSGMQEHFTTKVTGKGQIYLINKLKEFFNKESAICQSI